MSFERYDPEPFMPNGFHRVAVQHRVPATRAVVVHPRSLNEDVAIITIEPMPAQVQVQFPVIQGVVREFLENHLDVEVKEIQPCHLGQALVRFEFVHDRDRLVGIEHFHHDGLHFRLVRHNQGRNWKALNFNKECWLMLLGFPLDFWDQQSIENSICTFGRLLSWESDPAQLSRLIVRVRVTDL